MIKFFRKIRQKLLAENRFSKYLLYAIGEIILVVIGILIALQINNWNENIKSIALEKAYYCKIAEDLQVDIKNIDSSMVTIDKRLESAERFLKNLLKIQKDKQVIFKDFIPTFRYYKFIPTKAAIVDITSSGKLETLRNQTLKKRILSHYTEQDNALQIIDINDKAHNQKLFEIERFADFGFQEVPEYQSIIDEELQGLLSSTQWQQNPNDELFVKIKDVMILGILRTQREKELLTAIKAGAEELSGWLVENCN
ncbi:Hypothetical protein I595_1370 [Croceitalea dokdonensis DOKDO 023]|uniref:Uncharacterized protein n=1 Tax=Croceitalea dokdonensis DOKDO 023 TaxID=1300341 RepID=A0A0P7AXN1_9FLAO|nr:DUF6090 family protein [Croceitalea dokdonensis]KPM32943.1 Hypothetical protein I595_1370 [Croceitalea dokdonensis DOKDO 023]